MRRGKCIHWTQRCLNRISDVCEKRFIEQAEREVAAGQINHDLWMVAIFDSPAGSSEKEIEAEYTAIRAAALQWAEPKPVSEKVREFVVNAIIVPIVLLSMIVAIIYALSPLEAWWSRWSG
jgi:hypothetical protein